MTCASVEALTPAVHLEGDELVLDGLRVSGAAAIAAREAMDAGQDLDMVVQRMLEIGAMVLSHGTQSSVVEAVSRELRSHARTLAEVRDLNDKVAAKGLGFEEQILPVLERSFAPFSDIVEATGGTPGADGRDKKGDFTVTLNPAGLAGADRRVVVEAKDRPTQRLTGKDGALTYLDAAMRNRAAHAGVLVFATATPALADTPLRVYPGNRVLVRYDKDIQDPLALEVACHLARTLAAGVNDADSDTLDRGVLAEQVAKLTEIVEAAAEIRGGLLEAKRGLGRIDVAYQALRNDAKAVLGSLTEQLAA